jgi:hypothetical protein
MKRLLKLGATLGASFTGLLAAFLTLPIVGEIAVKATGVANSVPNWLIQATYAQTGPATIGEMTTEVTGFATTLMPNWLVYVVFALIAGVGIWLIGRAIRAMKSS